MEYIWNEMQITDSRSIVYERGDSHVYSDDKLSEYSFHERASNA